MSFENLSQEGFVEEIKQVTIGPHPSKFCFVLGAGASKSSGIKMGQELVDIWEKELIKRNKQDYDNWKSELGITEENKYNFYSQYYEKRYKKRPIDGLNFLEKMMEHVNPNVGYVMLSYLLTRTIHNVVITTNFDHLTEDAVNYYTSSLPLIIGHESLAHYISEDIRRPTIIKIHRDLLFDPKNTVEDVEILHDEWKEGLDRIFSEYHPVFIGYAGNDNSLMDYLIGNIEKFKAGSWKFPYWTLYQFETPNEKVQEFLNGADGYCIRCDGFDALLCQIGAKLDYKMPTKEELLHNTKERYQKLIDAFENIMSNISTSFNDEKLNLKPDNSGQNERLEQAMQKIINETDFPMKYITAINLHNQGKYKEAALLKQEMVKEYPENARYHNSLAATLYKQERYKEAEEEARKAVELEPETALYHNSLATTLCKQEKYKEAEEEARKAVELEPENALYHNNLVVTLHEQEKYEEAEAEARKAVELEPETARYHNNLGETYHKQEKYEEAEAEKRKAIELEPEN
ncbi:MAG: tetratricopeptide repeat protein, partial [Lachnospiraceae bacterium]|nr:tetratricopeptide repeat protein [Lachnospiraceae bacterium]